MSNKFTYIDFLMYVLPGSFLSFVVLILIRCTFPEIANNILKADVFSSIIFLIFSFIFGNFLQARSHLGPEKRLKGAYWDGLYPSQIMFFSGNKILNEAGRKDLISACLQKGLLTDEDVSEFSTPAGYNEKAVDKAQNAFNYMRAYLSDSGKGETVKGAEGYFLFFRGMFVASFWSAMAFMLVAILYLIRLQWSILNDLLGKPPDLLIGFVIPLFCASLSLILWRTFRYRCRGTAQGVAKEVSRTFCALVFIKDRDNIKN